MGKLLKAFFFISSLFFFHPAWSQVKIGEYADRIDPNSLLELESKTRGVLFPRIGLDSISSPRPLSKHIAGMVLYNVNTNGLGAQRVTPGLYYNDGSKWVRAEWNSSGTNNTNQLIISKVYHIAASNQVIFGTPFIINSKNDVQFYRNGVLIDFEIESDFSIKSEIACEPGDEIKIIQFKY